MTRAKTLTPTPYSNPFLKFINQMIVESGQSKDSRFVDVIHYSRRQASTSSSKTVRGIKATKKRIHPVLHPLFNLTMQNKIDHVNRILCFNSSFGTRVKYNLRINRSRHTERFATYFIRLETLMGRSYSTH